MRQLIQAVYVATLLNVLAPMTLAQSANDERSAGPAGCNQNDQCPPRSIIEDEICGASTNGGCNDPPNEPVQHIACGNTVCGTFWWDETFRDSDWYEFQILSPSLVTWNVFADVAVDSFILDSGCVPKVLATGAGECPSTATATCLPAGTYRVFVAASFSNPFIQCFSSQSNYVANRVHPPNPVAVKKTTRHSPQRGHGRRAGHPFAVTLTPFVWSRRDGNICGA